MKSRQGAAAKRVRIMNNSNNTIEIKYNSSVMTAAGWRSVEITAIAEKISEKRARVTAVVLIDGEIPAYGQSRTGAKRQKYNGLYFAEKEIGKTKILSKCIVTEGE